MDNSRWRKDDRKMDDRKREADSRDRRDREEWNRREEVAEKKKKPVLKSVVANHSR